MMNMYEDNEGSDQKLIEEKIIKVNGEIGIRTYTKGKKLGKGGFGEVYEFICNETNAVYAAKMIPKSILKSSREHQKLMSEIKLHRSVHHDCIVRFESFFENSRFIFILLELCESRTLLEMLMKRSQLTEQESQSLLYQLILGVKHLHSKNIIHRDLKPDNLFLTKNMQLKIGDFGLACKLSFPGERKRSVCGTPNYIAPEVLKRDKGYSFGVDVWGIGVIAYTMVCGRPPFYHQQNEQIYLMIRKGYYVFPEDQSLSPAFVDFVSQILVAKPENRPSLDDLLMHPFFIESPFPRLLPQSSLKSPTVVLRKQRQQTRIENHVVVDNSNTEGNMESKFSPRSPLRTPRSTTKKTINSRLNFEGKIWVKKWIDYLGKYGLGYLMASNHTGVYFNDATKMMDLGHEFVYFSKSQSHCFDFQEFPEEIAKKVDILRLFSDIFRSECQDQEYIYIHKWITTPRATIFRLSNKDIQVFFNDKSEIFVSQGEVVYVNKKGISKKEIMADINENSGGPIAKRVKYIKETFMTIVNSPK